MVAKAEAKEWAREHVTGLWGVHWVPFDEDDNVDEAQLRDHVERVLRQPMAGLSVAGMLDELFYVSIPERRRIAEVVAEVARGRLPMYCSATTDSIRDTLDLVRHAHDLGYDMAMVWPSPEHARSDKILYEFYAYLDRHSPIAISAYSTPHSGRLMSPEVAGAVAKLESVCVIKYVTWDFRDYLAAKDEVGDNAVISFPMEDRWLMSKQMFGNPALYSTTSVNLFAAADGRSPIAEYTKEAEEGNWTEAYRKSLDLQPLRDLWTELYEVYRTEHRHPYAETKYWAHAVGLLDNPAVRRPQEQAGPAVRAKIWRTLDEAGLALSPAPEQPR